MLLSIALIFTIGMFTGWICKKIKLPSLIGMLATGIVLGPYVLNLIDPSILSVSTDLRKIALIIILTRAGLGLDVSSLKKIGRPALMMCFVPAAFEMIGVTLLAPHLLNLSYLDSAILGAVLAAVSPAVVVPRMVKLMDEKYGTSVGIPQLILAGASVDDVFVIVMFSTFVGIRQGDGVSVLSIANIPVSIILGIAIGYLVGWALSKYFEKVHIRDTSKVLIILSVSLILVVIENTIPWQINFASLISIMFMGIALNMKRPAVAKRVSLKFSKLWVAAEILLFVLVGASVNIGALKTVGVMAVLMILGALLFRMSGVLLCLVKTNFNVKERVFAMFSYMPKATVQAAIGGLALDYGFSCGEVVLMVAVLAIVITAPLGAFLIDLTYKRLLSKD